MRIPEKIELSGSDHAVKVNNSPVFGNNNTLVIYVTQDINRKPTDSEGMIISRRKLNAGASW